MTAIHDRHAIIRHLERDPLGNVVLLKHLAAYPAATEALSIGDGEALATLVLMQAAATPYDRAAYPDAAVVAFIASPSAALTTALIARVPLEGGAVFKLAGEADRAALAACLPAEQVRAYHSFTAATGARRDPAVRITATLRAADFALLALQGHERSVLSPLLAAGEAFVAVTDDPDDPGQPASICCAFRNHGPVFEVGGVVTRPDRRGRGLARRVVTTALAVIEERGLLARYHVEEGNHASLRLADGIGLRRFLTLTHHRIAAGASFRSAAAAGVV